METIHFISGLPRSGSTLLSAILRQNPKIHAGMSSPVFNLLAALQVSMSAKHEGHPLITNEIRRDVLRGAFEGYYLGLSDLDIIFDTNRAWCGRLSLINELFPKAKIVCCVRGLPWIFDSIERIVRSNPLEPSRMFGFEAGGNVYSRVDTLMAPAGMVGHAFSCLKDSFYGEFSDKLIILPYEVLARHPVKAISELYEALDLDPFMHNFDHVEYSADDFDLNLGARGLHNVSGNVEYRPRSLNLPPDIVQRYEYADFWNRVGKAIRRPRIIGADWELEPALETTLPMALEPAAT
jgi:sulfotransferase